MSEPPTSPDAVGSAQWFRTTHWSVVLEARALDSPMAMAALEHLCRTYWYPLYSFARRKGNSPPDSEDLTQGFFARMLEKNTLRDVNRERGKFRSFLLKHRATIPGALVLAGAHNILAADRQVPAEYPTIQAAVNAAASGDTILIAPDGYVEQTWINLLAIPPMFLLRCWNP